ncbi:two-component system capsular synthesis response regulator RcsB [Burkholderia ambifaria]|nr:response regulator transcription factor [Burkholderia ambifaria]MDR6504148.1 two-component system capsular synthesis response regulator RcsB [Burkholderia ambifaria]
MGVGTNGRIQLVVADDHRAVVSGLVHTLSSAGDVDVAGVAYGPTELLSVLERTRCEVLLCDYSMPRDERPDGVELFRLVANLYPAVRIAVLTMYDNHAVVKRLVDCGISCIVSKGDSISHVVPVIHAAYWGATYFSPRIAKLEPLLRGSSRSTVWTRRETEVIELFLSGLGTGDIAEQLGIAKQTVSTLKRSAMEKLGIQCDVDLLKYAIAIGHPCVSKDTTEEG